MKFSEGYVSEEMAGLVEQFEKDYERAEISIDVEGSPDGKSFNNPDILDLMDFLGGTADKSACDKLVRQCVVGKNVTFYMDGDSIGSIRMNNVNDPWSVFPVFADYPMAYKTLADVVTIYLLKKSKLPRKKGTGPGAVAAVVN